MVILLIFLGVGLELGFFGLGWRKKCDIEVCKV